MVKKFFKTYYSLPDKHNRIDVVFERGFKNIQVLYNAVEIANYNSASMLSKTTEINTPDESVIHIRFLKDTTDFEVHFNASQIDHSETKPEVAIRSLKWPVIACLAWYTFVLIFFLMRTNGFSIIVRNPEYLFTEPRILYTFTSSLFTAIVLSMGLLLVKSGKMFFYYLTIIFLIIDACYGIITPFAETVMYSFKFDVTIILLFLPLFLKSVAIYVYVTNINLYKQYYINKTELKRKTNPDLVDLA